MIIKVIKIIKAIKRRLIILFQKISFFMRPFKSDN